MTPEEELRELYRMREYVKQRITMIELGIQNVAVTNSNVYVKTADLRPYVQEWINLGHSLQTLAHKAVVSDTTLVNILRMKTEYTKEVIADKILTALDMPHVQLEVYEQKWPSVPKPPQGFFED